MKAIRSNLATIVGAFLSAFVIQIFLMAFIVADVPPSALTFGVTTKGAPSESDRDVFRMVIDKDNASRTNSGLAPWPSASNADYRTSYELFLAASLMVQHTNYIPLAYSPEVVESKIAKPDKREIDKAVLDLISSGATVTDILQRLR